MKHLALVEALLRTTAELFLSLCHAQTPSISHRLRSTTLSRLWETLSPQFEKFWAHLTNSQHEENRWDSWKASANHQLIKCPVTVLLKFFLSTSRKHLLSPKNICRAGTLPYFALVRKKGRQVFPFLLPWVSEHRTLRNSDYDGDGLPRQPKSRAAFSRKALQYGSCQVWKVWESELTASAYALLNFLASLTT